MKALPLSILCSVLVLSASFAQGSGLTIEFDEDTPASERQAFVEAYKHQQDINRNSHNERKVVTHTAPATKSTYTLPPIPEEDGTLVGSLNRIKAIKEQAAISIINNDRIMAENGDSQGLTDSRREQDQERSNRRTAEQLRQIQNTQREIQNRQRGIGY